LPRTDRRKKRKTSATLRLSQLPKSVLAYYQACADKLNMSVAEYIALKLMSECFAELTGRTFEGRASAVTFGTTSKGTKSGYKGVYTYGKRWQAAISEGGKQQRLGVFDTPEEAAHAYDAALIARAGGDKLAAVNFPTENDQLRDVVEPFIEKFATGDITDIEWGTWQKATRDLAVPQVSGPLPVLPPQNGKPDPRAPLIDRPATTLYRRPPEEPPPAPETPPKEPSDA
jgi:hypothetical protein